MNTLLGMVLYFQALGLAGILLTGSQLIGAGLYASVFLSLAAVIVILGFIARLGKK